MRIYINIAKQSLLRETKLIILDEVTRNKRLNIWFTWFELKDICFTDDLLVVLNNDVFKFVF